jgi:foldase protein PrsA
MKRVLTAIFMVMFIISHCSKLNQGKLKPGTPAYQFAKELAVKINYLDPDKNNILIKTKYFDLTVDEVIQDMMLKDGSGVYRLRNLTPTQLKENILLSAKVFANQRLILVSAQKENIMIQPAEIDSILNRRYQKFGGMNEYLKGMQNLGFTNEMIKKDIEQLLIGQKYLKKVSGDKLQITEEEVLADYRREKIATIQHIMLKTVGKNDAEKQQIRATIEEILARIKKGEDMGALARQYSDDLKTKENGGIIKDIRRTRLESLNEAAFSLPIKEISGVIETKVGYHLIKVLERHSETKPLIEVRPEIEAQLHQAKQMMIYNQQISKLKEEANYQVQNF